MLDHLPLAGSVLRPRDGDALRGELRSTAAQVGLPVMFGGTVTDDTLRLTEFVGTRTTHLAGLSIPPRSGLGGRVLAHRRPFAVSDYGRSTTITHHFDRPVHSEGLRSILAVPVVVDGDSRAVLYAASRACTPVGDRATDAIVAAGRRLGAEIAIRDEVDRRVQLLRSMDTSTTNGMSAEELRDVHTELRTVAQNVEDAGTRNKLRALSQRLAAAMTPPADDRDRTDTPGLTPREVDVLAAIALGCTNSDAAQRLSLGAETVKSYLRSAMRKLDAHSRHEAVVTARKLGLLP